MRVCYFGMARPGYSRHRVIARGLRQLGVEVVECFVSHRLNRRQAGSALRAGFAGTDGKFDALLVAEFNHVTLPLAWQIARARRLPIVYDFFVSLYDSEVNDRGRIAARSPRALWLWLLDWLAARIPTMILTDTAAQRDFYARQFRADPKKCEVVPVGFDDEVFRPVPMREPAETFQVLFYGSFIPLHGADVIARAAALLPDVRFTLIGDGQTLPETKAVVNTRQAANVTFLPPVPIIELPTWIGGADTALGIFSRGEKTRRVVPHKVYQSLAVGRPVVTADTPAVREFFSPGEHLLTCQPGSPEALAEALACLQRDRPLRRRLAEQGRRHVVEHYSPAPIARRVGGAIEKAMGRV